jgi:2-oxoglutarate ferredoxin oxidoreductase subunit delta
LADKVTIEQDLCTGCGICVAMCPRQILEIDPETDTCRVTDPDKCDQLGGCEFQCPTGAITVDPTA